MREGPNARKLSANQCSFNCPKLEDIMIISRKNFDQVFFDIFQGV